ncbi:hypothetical protein L596_001556 [Steinernema carpocapsae]|uniref:Uncharacterized protein n=1 Tax=Steinernema carpocapsae TaxID=34508 RepID=A0A4U8ULW4_STECR|nr:hypothetical protein L596_001556 [Steinernema carpocapsae]
MQSGYIFGNFVLLIKKTATQQLDFWILSSYTDERTQLRKPVLLKRMTAHFSGQRLNRKETAELTRLRQTGECDQRKNH